MFSYENNFRVSFDPHPLLPALRTRWGTGAPRSKEGKAPLFTRGENTRHKGELGRPAEQLGISKCCSGQRKQNAEHVWKSSVCFRKYSCKSTQIFDHPKQIQLSCPLRFSVFCKWKAVIRFPLSSPSNAFIKHSKKETLALGIWLLLSQNTVFCPVSPPDPLILKTGKDWRPWHSSVSEPARPASSPAWLGPHGTGIHLALLHRQPYAKKM